MASSVRFVVELEHQYRLTKYDPALRDERGAFKGDDWTAISDIGRTFDGKRLTLADYLDVEARHLIVLASFIEESGVEALTPVTVERLRKSRLKEGERLSPVEAIEVVRAMLREEPGWCRLIDADRFYIHVGWDYYVYVGSDQSCERSVKLAEELGLFLDINYPSPYLHRDDDEPEGLRAFMYGWWLRVRSRIGYWIGR